MITLGLVGEPGSGKGTVSEYLEKTHSATRFRSSYVLDEILKHLGIPNERANQTMLVSGLRNTFGEDVLAKSIAHSIETSENAVNVIDGIRMPKEVETYDQIPSFHLVYVTAPVEMRHEKIIKRGEKAGEENLTLEEFKHFEETKVTEIHIGEIGSKAEFRIDNTGTLEELYAKVDEVMNQLKK